MEVIWISLKDVATRASLSVATVRRAARTGRLRGIKVNNNRLWRFRPEWVDEWMEGGAR
jgi:excisionase family DNA binding protein